MRLFSFLRLRKKRAVVVADCLALFRMKYLWKKAQEKALAFPARGHIWEQPVLFRQLISNAESPRMLILLPDTLLEGPGCWQTHC